MYFMGLFFDVLGPYWFATYQHYLDNFTLFGPKGCCMGHLFQMHLFWDYVGRGYYPLPPFTQWEKDWVKIGFLVFLKNIMLKQLRILPKWLLDVKFDLGLCFELPRSLEAAEAIRGRGQIWHPEVRASH